ncbi:unnamed protein product [Durusdinium trenchii]|uniref:Uncharacterized protein n=1 Tax=Durusdinium trenchii TaxID=1381693 RepID=A0ABP0R3A2_9DINO
MRQCPPISPEREREQDWRERERNRERIRGLLRSWMSCIFSTIVPTLGALFVSQCAVEIRSPMYIYIYIHTYIHTYTQQEHLCCTGVRGSMGLFGPASARSAPARPGAAPKHEHASHQQAASGDAHEPYLALLPRPGFGADSPLAGGLPGPTRRPDRRAEKSESKAAPGRARRLNTSSATLPPTFGLGCGEAQHLYRSAEGSQCDSFVFAFTDMIGAHTFGPTLCAEPAARTPPLCTVEGATSRLRSSVRLRFEIAGCQWRREHEDEDRTSS